MNRIYVVTHKKVKKRLPKLYKYIQVGKSFSNEDYGYLSDDTGDNIALKNKNYCELTALYWIWKNVIDVDVVGICHYRRFFTKNYYSNSALSFITSRDIDKILKKYDVIVPQKEDWKEYTVREYYSKCNGFDKDINTTREGILKMFPDYIQSFDVVMSSHKAFYFNMFILKKELFDSYCEWLFAILNYVEEHTDISNYSKQEARIFGYISEILLNVWIEKNKLKYKELKVVNVETSIFWKLKKLINK